MTTSSEGLARFRHAQAGANGPGHAEALREIRAGRKVSHWIWYVLPQLRGLGRSAMAVRYGIADLAEARAYLADPVLGPRLAEITAAIAEQLQAGVPLTDLLGELDACKAVSCLTLFERAGADLAAASFLGHATAVLERAEVQGLPRCPTTLARLGQGEGAI